MLPPTLADWKRSRALLRVPVQTRSSGRAVASNNPAVRRGQRQSAIGWCSSATGSRRLRGKRSPRLRADGRPLLVARAGLLRAAACPPNGLGDGAFPPAGRDFFSHGECASAPGYACQGAAPATRACRGACLGRPMIESRSAHAFARGLPGIKRTRCAARHVRRACPQWGGFAPRAGGRASASAVGRHSSTSVSTRCWAAVDQPVCGCGVMRRLLWYHRSDAVTSP